MTKTTLALAVSTDVDSATVFKEALASLTESARTDFEIDAKRKKQSKAQKRKAGTVRGKARKVSKAALRTAARAKPKRAPVKKTTPKVKQPVAPAVETVAVEVIEQPVAVTEVEETRKAS